VRLCPLGVPATVSPIVTAPDDRWWSAQSSWWNEKWQRKLKCSEKTCPIASLYLMWPDLGCWQLMAWAMARPQIRLQRYKPVPWHLHILNIIRDGHRAVYCVEALCYKPERHGFYPWWGHRVFSWPDPSSHTAALGWTHSLTEKSTRNHLGGQGRSEWNTANPPSVRQFLQQVGASTFHNYRGLQILLHFLLYQLRQKVRNGNDVTCQQLRT
jgi:hypothetical protein